MASIKDLKKRIGTVRNTQQTTRAMKMVSAAKLRRSQEAILSQRPYAQQIAKLIQLAVRLATGEGESPLIRRDLGSGVSGKGLLVVLTSDRGLCGGFNSSIIKAAIRWLQENQSRFTELRICCVGKRGYEAFRGKPWGEVEHYEEFGGKVVFLKAKSLSDHLINQYLSGRADEIHIIYNEFKNAISQKVIVEKFLPLSAVPGVASEINPKQEDEDAVGVGNYLIKPSQKEVLEQLLKKHFSIQAFRVLLESQASEHGARMSAMENATKNAGEMIQKLTLQYNKQRQAGITKELLEIISGSESQKV